MDKVEQAIRAFHVDIQHQEKNRDLYRELYFICVGPSRIRWFRKWREADKIIKELKKGNGRRRIGKNGA